MSEAPARDGTDVATTATATDECRVYYQDTKGAIHEHIHLPTGWQPATTLALAAKPASPLASVSFDSGKEVHVYYVSVAGYLEEYVYKFNKGWKPGPLNDFKFSVSEASKLAAVSWPEDSGIRVYAQNHDGTIQEYQYEASKGWRNPVVLPVAQVGSSLAALVWTDKGHHIRVYYIADSTVKEQRYDPKEGWRPGIPVAEAIPPYASIAAVLWSDTRIHQRVYLQDSSENIVEYEWDTANTEWSDKGRVVGPLRPGRSIAALAWRTGAELRVYYQDDDNKIREEAKSNEGAWYQGEFVAP
ncbi:fucose-specific lectin [Xylaria curta]|nr:fucose-specific lectin [Xylaria curta]